VLATVVLQIRHYEHNVLRQVTWTP
jgi:hypothetical protein